MHSHPSLARRGRERMVGAGQAWADLSVGRKVQCKNPEATVFIESHVLLQNYCPSETLADRVKLLLGCCVGDCCACLWAPQRSQDRYATPTPSMGVWPWARKHDEFFG